MSEAPKRKPPRRNRRYTVTANPRPDYPFKVHVHAGALEVVFKFPKKAECLDLMKALRFCPSVDGMSLTRRNRFIGFSDGGS